MKISKKSDKFSGLVELINNEVIFKSNGNIIDKFLISNVKVIAEFTTDSDMSGNDYFLVFVENDNVIHYVPVYAQNFENFIQEIEVILNLKITFSLANSIRINSNIIFPKDFQNRKLFQFVTVEPTGFWQTLFVIFSKIKPTKLQLAEYIIHYKK
ncbi:MAG: hypothetical protein RLZZ175_880 [Bacteroidota bacterium]|jgi:hypothetical protein